MAVPLPGRWQVESCKLKKADRAGGEAEGGFRRPIQDAGFRIQRGTGWRERPGSTPHTVASAQFRRCKATPH